MHLPLENSVDLLLTRAIRFRPFVIADGARLLIQPVDVGRLQRETDIFFGFDGARGGADGIAQQMGLSLPPYSVACRTI